MSESHLCGWKSRYGIVVMCDAEILSQFFLTVLYKVGQLLITDSGGPISILEYA